MKENTELAFSPVSERCVLDPVEDVYELDVIVAEEFADEVALSTDIF
ncbi:MAG TPA: hypothetical protein VJN71_08295 [Nitrososphaerales archaeon]|nr:hypothetical protein [Nitrososphaerales archaeon]